MAFVNNSPVLVGTPIYVNGRVCGGYTYTSGGGGSATIAGDPDHTCDTRSGSTKAGLTMIAIAPVLPTVNIYPDAASVPLNKATNIHWSSEYTTDCSITIMANGVTTPSGWTVNPNVDGSHTTGNLTWPTTYTINCDGSFGGKVTMSATVSIDPPDMNLQANPTSIDVCASPIIACGGDPNTCGRSVVSWGPIINVTSSSNCKLSGNWSGTLSSPDISLSPGGVLSPSYYPSGISQLDGCYLNKNV